MGNPTTAKNQGEGNRDADREYREGAERHAKTGKSEQEGRDAEAALEGDEAEKLSEAERAGKAPSKGPASR